MGDSYIYHLVQEAKWKDAGAEGYLPPTYAADGFIHATKEGHLLLPVANHFYTGWFAFVPALFSPFADGCFTNHSFWLLVTCHAALSSKAVLPRSVFHTLY